MQNPDQHQAVITNSENTMSEQDSNTNITGSTASKKKKAHKAAAKKTAAKQQKPEAGEPSQPADAVSVKPEAVTTARPRNWSGRVALLLVLALIMALTGVIWQRGWWNSDNTAQQQLQTTQSAQLDQLRQQLADLQNDIQQIGSQDINAAVEPLIVAAQQQTRAESQLQLQRMDNALTAIQQTNGNQQNRLQALENKLTDVSTEQQHTQNVIGREQALQEIKLLLRHARQQITLNSNTAAAISAYQDAERILNAAELPDSYTLQAALINERQIIQAIQIPDIDALVNQLIGLQQAIALWPMRGAPVAKSGDIEPAEQNWRSKLRNSFGQLVQVRKTDEPVIGIEQANLIRQQLSLHFQVASLLALQGRQAPFVQVLDDAQQSLEQAFSSDNPGVQAALETLQSMHSVQLVPDWPELTAAIDQLDALTLRVTNTGVAD